MFEIMIHIYNVDTKMIQRCMMTATLCVPCVEYDFFYFTEIDLIPMFITFITSFVIGIEVSICISVCFFIA